MPTLILPIESFVSVPSVVKNMNIVFEFTFRNRIVFENFDGWFLFDGVASGVFGFVDVVEDIGDGNGDGDVLALNAGKDALGLNHDLHRTELAWKGVFWAKQ